MQITKKMEKTGISCKALPARLASFSPEEGRTCQGNIEIFPKVEMS